MVREDEVAGMDQHTAAVDRDVVADDIEPADRARLARLILGQEAVA